MFNKVIYAGILKQNEEKITATGLKMNYMVVGDDDMKFVAFKDVAAEALKIEVGAVVVVEGYLKYKDNKSKTGYAYKSLDVQVTKVHEMQKKAYNGRFETQQANTYEQQKSALESSKTIKNDVFTFNEDELPF